MTQGITFLDILKEEIKIKSLQNDIFQLNLLDQNLIFTSISIQFQITLYLIFIHIPILEPNKSFKKTPPCSLILFETFQKNWSSWATPTGPGPPGSSKGVSPHELEKNRVLNQKKKQRGSPESVFCVLFGFLCRIPKKRDTERSQRKSLTLLGKQ